MLWLRVSRHGLLYLLVAIVCGVLMAKYVKARVSLTIVRKLHNFAQCLRETPQRISKQRMEIENNSLAATESSLRISDMLKKIPRPGSQSGHPAVARSVGGKPRRNAAEVIQELQAIIEVATKMEVVALLEKRSALQKAANATKAAVGLHELYKHYLEDVLELSAYSANVINSTRGCTLFGSKNFSATLIRKVETELCVALHNIIVTMCTPGTGGLVELMLDIEKAVRTTSKLRDKINATERYANATVSAFMGVGNESAYGDAEALEVKVAAAPLPPAFTRYGQIITSLKLLHASV